LVWILAKRTTPSTKKKSDTHATEDRRQISGDVKQKLRKRAMGGLIRRTWIKGVVRQDLFGANA
jgi:hypothetical protein